VPRSGTKGLARALNLHPHVYCALERFSYKRDHSRVAFPDSFVRADDVADLYGLRKVQKVRDDLAGRNAPRCVGNKQPRYYFALERVNRELPRLKNILIYRSPAGFMQSWNRKGAAAGRKGRWSAGQVGVFGVIELICCIDSCVRLDKDVLLFPYEEGLNQSSEPVLKTLDFLGVERAPFDLEEFESVHLPMRLNRARPGLAAHENELLASLRIDDLEHIIGTRAGVLSSSDKRDLTAYLESITDELAPALDRVFRTIEDNPAVAVFATQYFNQYRRELRPLRHMLEKSQAVSMFERPMLTWKIRQYYSHRSEIIRRLKSHARRRKAAILRG
jgi:hypothetical protein